LGGKEPAACGLPGGFDEDLSRRIAKSLAKSFKYQDGFKIECLGEVTLGPRLHMSKITKYIQCQIWMRAAIKKREADGLSVPPSLSWMVQHRSFAGDDTQLLIVADGERAAVADFEFSPTMRGYTAPFGSVSQQVDELTIHRLREEVGATIILDPAALTSDPAIAKANHSERVAIWTAENPDECDLPVTTMLEFALRAFERFGAIDRSSLRCADLAGKPAIEVIVAHNQVVEMAGFLHLCYVIVMHGSDSEAQGACDFLRRVKWADTMARVKTVIKSVASVHKLTSSLGPLLYGLRWLIQQDQDGKQQQQQQQQQDQQLQLCGGDGRRLDLQLLIFHLSHCDVTATIAVMRMLPHLPQFLVRVLVTKACGLPLEFQPGNIKHKCITLRLHELRQSLLDCEQSDESEETCDSATVATDRDAILTAIDRLQMKLEVRCMAYAWAKEVNGGVHPSWAGCTGERHAINQFP
jgi:hypothetical protein